MIRKNRIFVVMICKRLVSGHGHRGMDGKMMIIFLLLLQFAGNQKTGASKCMPDVYSSQDGKVVIYDSVVQVPLSELYIIGPQTKLWIVRETPELQKNTVFFPHHFQRGSSVVPRAGSTCTFSWGTPQPNSTSKNALDTALWQLRTTLMDFLHDPLHNINVAYCAIPKSAMQELLDDVPVRVAVHMVPVKEGDEKYVLDLPVCLARPRSPPQVSLSTLPAFASLCCIIRDEAQYLVEWIEYSRMIGVDHFFLYDHGSTDGTVEVSSVCMWHLCV